MKMKYSHTIAEAVKDVFDDIGWHYRWNEEMGVIRYGIKLNGRLHSADCSLRVSEDSFTTYTVCPLSGNPDDRENMLALAEFFSRANYDLIHGCFELDFRDGEIRYRVTMDCDGVVPSPAVVKDAINLPGQIMDRYGDGIVAVLYGRKSAEEAAQECEKKIAQQRDELQRMLLERLEAALARLTEDGDASDAEDDEDETVAVDEGGGEDDDDGLTDFESEDEEDGADGNYLDADTLTDFDDGDADDGDEDSGSLAS